MLELQLRHIGVVRQECGQYLLVNSTNLSFVVASIWFCSNGERGFGD